MIFIRFTFLAWILLSCWSCNLPQPTSPVTELHRPAFHFSPPEKWMNDPNGMVYYEGEYHLFYQYYPDSTVWGPMHWGHAVSKDLVRWEHLPIALYPDSLGLIFSGSAVVDRDNTSSFGQNGQPPLVAIFTHHNMPAEKQGKLPWQYQSIAYSNDKGRTWTKYAGNPVMPNPHPSFRDFRDPKVVWDAGSKQWVMALAVGDHTQFWGSPDLKNWAYLGDFGKTWGAHGGVWECPDLFPIVIEGTQEQRWVLLKSLNPGGPNGGSGTQYFVGNFDGRQFIPDPDFLPSIAPEGSGRAVWLDYGRDNYAGVTWSDVPAADGRRLFIGWMSNWDYAQVVPTKTWRSAMTLPRVLTLRKTPAGLRLFSEPVKELESLRGKKTTLAAQTIDGALELPNLSPRQLELVLEIEPTPGVTFTIELSNSKGEVYRIGYEAANRQFFSDRTRSGKTAFSEAFAKSVHTAPRIADDGPIKLHLFFDCASAELFADNGATSITEVFFPDEDYHKIRLVASGGQVRLVKGEGFELAYR
jgi:fructan beta-fructosidase